MRAGKALLQSGKIAQLIANGVPFVTERTCEDERFDEAIGLSGREVNCDE